VVQRHSLFVFSAMVGRVERWPKFHTPKDGWGQCAKLLIKTAGKYRSGVSLTQQERNSELLIRDNAMPQQT
jgi:hypothetical protein